MTFTFDRDSIAHRVSEVLAHRKEYVELGIEAARIFAEQYSPEAGVRSWLTMADTLRLGMSGHIRGIQDFLVWPPEHI